MQIPAIFPHIKITTQLPIWNKIKASAKLNKFSDVLEWRINGQASEPSGPAEVPVYLRGYKYFIGTE